jgi:hypothetical protein
MGGGHVPVTATLQHDRVDDEASELHGLPPRLGVSAMARDIPDQPCPLSAGITHHALRYV